MAIRLNNLALLFLVGEPFEFGGYVCEMLYCAGVKVCLPMTIRSDIPCPRPFKRDNHFIMLEKGIFLKPFQGFANKALFRLWKPNSYEEKSSVLSLRFN